MNYIAIKYKKIKIAKNDYILFPIALINDSEIKNFEMYDINNIKTNNFLIDGVLEIKDLKKLYNYNYRNDENKKELDQFLVDYFYESEKDNIIIATINNDNKLTSKKVNINNLKYDQSKAFYKKVNDDEVVTLNNEALDNLLKNKNIKDLKIELLKYKEKINNFKEKSIKKDITKIEVLNGHVVGIEMNNRHKKIAPIIDKKTMPTNKEDISLTGLENYIKERVFGHNDEIRKIAKTLIMNYTAKDNEKVESILLIGPTGTGKTETIKAAMNYLDIPMIEVNTINLVPQGIKGMSLEDCLYSLYAMANNDIKKAERGLIFFDEFDKLGGDVIDYKEAVKSIFLKFIEGSSFLIGENENIKFNTSKLNKVFTGVFEDIINNKNISIGFNNTSDNKKDKIDEYYYNKELIDRIDHKYYYHELDNDTKKDILLHSKLSIYLTKKQRYLRQFGIDIIIDDNYINAIIDTLDKNKQSIRDLNNLISTSLDEAEYFLLTTNNKYHNLYLTKDTVINNKNFQLK